MTATDLHIYSTVHRLGIFVSLLAGVCLILVSFAVTPASATLGLTKFDGGTMLEDGEVATQAGSHPWDASTEFVFTGFVASDGYEYATEDFKNSIITLPAGAIPNPRGVPACSEFDLEGGESLSESNPVCPLDTQVGYVGILEDGNFSTPGHLGRYNIPLYNMKPPKGQAALLGFSFVGAIFHIGGTLRPVDYRPVAAAYNAPQTLPLGGIDVHVWGVPADPSHDSDRGYEGGGLSAVYCAAPDAKPSCSFSSDATPTAYFTLPTSCQGPIRTDITVTGWQGGEGSSSFLSHDNTEPEPNPVGIDGCNALEFSPSIEARPTTNVADAPTGLSVDLHIPQNEDPYGNVSAHLRKAVVTLPEGMVINPSGANGLQGCSPAQVDLQGADPAQCPDASRVGSVEVNTTLLDHPALGSVYVATPYDNPFKSLLALYLTVEDPQTGTIIKLPGEVQLNPITGRLTTSFDENPQVPFEDLKLKIFGGATAPLRTPDVCGTYSTTSSLTPWSAPDSGPPATPVDTYPIERGATGDSCPTSSGDRVNAPSFDAGTEAPLAGTNSPLVVNLRREDGSQQFSSVTLTPPPGLVGKLAGIPYCSEAALAAAATRTGAEEKSNPSCPAASEIGTVVAGAGAGPAPYYAKGTAYLTGPYHGAPLSLALITPATAGPFDLGTVVVRTALFVDPKTAQITAVSDPVPAMLQGIPLDIRTVAIKLDRPDFIRNPTSCDSMAFNGQLLSTLGQIAPLSSRFQLGECGRLGFEPKMTLRLKGGTARSKHPALTAVLETRPTDANLANISVALPHSEFLDQAHIGTVCTRVQFAASACPAASIYGTATVTTPLLDYPLTGPVYLRSSNNPLPDLVPDLRGPADQPIKLEAAGRTDSIHGGIRNTFEYVPDAPFSKFVLSLEGGRKGLLVNSRNICQKTYRATVKFGAYNGLRTVAHPALQAGCGVKAKKHRQRSYRRHANRHAAR